MDANFTLNSECSWPRISLHWNSEWDFNTTTLADELICFVGSFYTNCNILYPSLSAKWQVRVVHCLLFWLVTFKNTQGKNLALDSKPYTPSQSLICCPGVNNAFPAIDRGHVALYPMRLYSFNCPYWFGALLCGMEVFREVVGSADNPAKWLQLYYQPLLMWFSTPSTDSYTGLSSPKPIS